jgi:hypothetical protein
LKNSGDVSVSTLASGGSCGRNRPNKNVILNTDKLAKHAQPHKKNNNHVICKHQRAQALFFILFHSLTGCGSPGIRSFQESW